MRIIRLLIVISLFIACNPENQANEILPEFEAYHQYVRNQDAAKWAYTTDTLTIWMEDTFGNPRLSIKGQVSSGPWKEWDEVMRSTVTYDSIWYNDSLHAVQGYFYENNDFYTLIGKSPTKTLRTYWLNEQNKIHQLLIYWIPEENTTSSEHLGPIVEWAMKNDSSEIKTLYPEGRIVPSHENAERWKALLERYNLSKNQ